MIIKNIEEFENIDEGLLSSFFKGFNKVFRTKESQLESILKNIKKLKEEDLDNKVQIEKEIWELSKENTPESRFQISNLNRQSKAFSSLKEQEIFSLIKEANNIIKENPKLKAFFYSELSKIEVSIMDKFIKEIKQYKDISFIDALNKEFEDLVKDANKKSDIYTEYQKKEGYFLSEDFIKDIDQETIKFIDLTIPESYAKLRTYNNEQLEKIYKELKILIFNLNVEYQKLIDTIRKDIKKAQKEDQTWLIISLESQEREFRYYIKKFINKIKSKISLVEEEAISRNMAIKKLNNFIFEQATKNSPTEKAKNLQIKADIEKQMLEINKKISEADLAIANIIKREKDGTLTKSESYKQQAIELQKKVAEYQKKSIAYSKLEALEKK